VKFKRGSIQYWEVFRGDADLFAHAASRLRGYQQNLSWWQRMVSSFVIGFLNARADAMLERAATEGEG
jgi:hypothetical protein